MTYLWVTTGYSFLMLSILMFRDWEKDGYLENKNITPQEVNAVWYIYSKSKLHHFTQAPENCKKVKPL